MTTKVDPELESFLRDIRALAVCSDVDDAMIDELVTDALQNDEHMRTTVACAVKAVLAAGPQYRRPLLRFLGQLAQYNRFFESTILRALDLVAFVRDTLVALEADAAARQKRTALIDLIGTWVRLARFSDRRTLDALAKLLPVATKRKEPPRSAAPGASETHKRPRRQPRAREAAATAAPIAAAAVTEAPPWLDMTLLSFALSCANFDSLADRSQAQVYVSQLYDAHFASPSGLAPAAIESVERELKTQSPDDFVRRLQCKTCGVRQSSRQAMNAHLDDHFRREREKEARKSPARGWLPTEREWMEGKSAATPVEDDDVALTPALLETRVREHILAAGMRPPVDEGKTAVCLLCREPLARGFSADDEAALVYVAAVRVGTHFSAPHAQWLNTALWSQLTCSSGAAGGDLLCLACLGAQINWQDTLLHPQARAFLKTSSSSAAAAAATRP